MSSSAIQVAKTATFLPDLVEVQRASFKWFLDKGLIEELESFSPITDYTGKLELHFIGSEYRLKRPRHDVEEAKRRDATFASQMYVTCRLVNKETGEIKEQEVFIGELPLMTERGTFIINPEGKVVSSQVNYYNVGRNMEELSRIVEANVHCLAHPAEACPAKWSPGQKTLTPNEAMVGKVYEALNS